MRTIQETFANALLAHRTQVRRPVSDISHRLEWICTWNGIDFIDDGSSAYINSVQASLQCINRETIWIVLANEPGQNWWRLSAAVRYRVKAIVCIGAHGAELIDQLAEVIPLYQSARNLEDAVQKALVFASAGDAVLWSPGNPLSDTTEPRPEAFKSIVHSLIQ